MRLFKKLTYVVTGLLFVWVCILISNYFAYTKDRDQLAITKGQETTVALQKEVNHVLQKTMQSGQEIAKLLASNSYSEKELENFIKQRALAIDEILGVTVAYEPDHFPGRHLYAPYYDKQEAKVIQLESFYDYTDANLETTEWYVKIRDGGEGWVEPYFGQVVQALITDYGVPFYNQDGSLRGVVSMTISLDGFTDLIHSLSLGKTGFGFVSSLEGTVLAHPVTEYIGVKTISDLKAAELRPEMVQAYSEIEANQSGNTQFFDTEKRQKTLFFYDTVSASNWNIGVLFFEEDLLGPDVELKRKFINISLVVSLLLFCLLGVFFNRDYLSNKELWILSGFATIILLVNIFLVGYLEHTAPNAQVVSESPPVTDNTTLSSIVNAQNFKAKELKEEAPMTIPTGIFIDELAFEDSYNVNLSGVLWQKYDKSIVDMVTVGFRFPQAAPFAEAVFIDEIYRKDEGAYLLIGYEFRLTAKLNFVYRKYPFDKRNLNLEIQPINPSDNLLLVPDLDGYAVTNPSQKSGLSSNISLSGNKILESYFSYHFIAYDNTFGFANGSKLKESPELHFNINMKRVLINAFITYLIPIFVTLIMMFIMVYSATKFREENSDGGIVQGMTAFFFVLIFSHIDLRKNIETAELIYMEYFYFATYTMIILSTYNLIIYSRPKESWFDAKNNLLVKTTFWPLFLFMILLITLITFY